MIPVDSTYKILAYKILNHGVDLEWVSWAEEMLMAGFETEHLLILAGERDFFNQFEMSRLTDKIFLELNLSYDDEFKVIKEYVLYLIRQALEEKMKVWYVVDILDQLWRQHSYSGNEYDRLLHDFHELFYLKEDVKYGVTYQWPEATVKNVDEVARKHL